MSEQTDRERLTALLTEWGVGFAAESGSVELQAGREKVDGYNGFVAQFEFDDAGSFVTVGVWES